jgi:hypothetical protein
MRINKSLSGYSHCFRVHYFKLFSISMWMFILTNPVWSQHPDTTTWFAPESAVSLVNPQPATFDNIKAGKKNL